jgi:hypothetical protein
MGHPRNPGLIPVPGPGPGLEGEEPRERGPGPRAGEHHAEVQPRGDLADLVAVAAVDPRGAPVVQEQRRAAVDPARTVRDLPPHGADAEEAVDGRGAVVAEDLLSVAEIT